MLRTSYSGTQELLLLLLVIALAVVILLGVVILVGGVELLPLRAVDDELGGVAILEAAPK
jgi:hypothetical protein